MTCIYMYAYEASCRLDRISQLNPARATCRQDQRPERRVRTPDAVSDAQGVVSGALVERERVLISAHATRPAATPTRVPVTTLLIAANTRMMTV